MLLNNQENTEEIKEEIKKYTQTNDNENTMIQNLWDATKAVLRGKFTAIQSHLRKQEKDFPGGPVAKTLPSQCKGPRFDSWPGN